MYSLIKISAKLLMLCILVTSLGCARSVNKTYELAEQGDVDAQYSLGKMYANGEDVLEDNKKAFYWYSKAAEQGDAKAQLLLGMMYYKGKGVPEDISQAFYWYQKAAKQGNADAQLVLGVMYAIGGGRVSQDNNQAFYWYSKAAEQGDAKAQFGLGEMYYYGLGMPQDTIAALMWFNLAAEGGYQYAAKLKNLLANKMSSSDIKKAQERASQCIANKYKGC